MFLAMGRIKTTPIKRITKKLIAEHGSEFKKDFNSNKEVVTKFIDTPSKKLRNIIAGYATRLSKEKK